jgi:predicted nucleic acid-binding Zn ribbon protein
MSPWKPLRRDRPGPRPVGESVERVASRLGAPPVAALKTVFGDWRDAVGDAVADHAEPLSLTDGVLVVAVDQPGWATQLKLLAPELIERINDRAGDGTVQSLEVRVKGARRRR